MSDEIDNIMKTINSAKLVLELHEQATHAPHGVADRRLKVLELALGTWMLKIAGIVPGSPHAQPNEFSAFVTWFQQFSRATRACSPSC